MDGNKIAIIKELKDVISILELQLSRIDTLGQDIAAANIDAAIQSLWRYIVSN